MIFNAIFPHLIVTFLIKTYALGLAIALLLNIPINTVILYKLHNLNLVTLKEIVISTVVIGMILLAMIPLLFMLGGKFNKLLIRNGIFQTGNHFFVLIE